MEKLKKQFLQQGWFVFDFLDPKPVLQARAFLKSELCKLVGKEISLEEYHREVDDDEEHTDMQITLTQAYREQGFRPQIIARQLPFFKELLGPDLFVQANPYLRIARPNKGQDNIGYHRDTFYGGSPFELSVLVPFVDLPVESSLSILPGSHIHSEKKYPTHQRINPDKAVRKGTAKHQLGFLYAPKVMGSEVDEQMVAVPLKVGQALVFSLSTVHGSKLNASAISRWSSDIRVMNALSPVDLRERPDYYKPMSYSVVTESAKQYMYANGKETRDDVELELCHTAS